MSLKLTRIVILACSFLLTLPPGWCCLVEAHASAYIGKPGQTRCNSCCCRRVTEEARPSRQVPPSPRPGECPCDERNSTSPELTAKADCTGVNMIAADVVLHRPLPIYGVRVAAVHHLFFPPTTLRLILSSWLR